MIKEKWYNEWKANEHINVISFVVDAEEIKRLGSAINILSTEKLKATQKVSVRFSYFPCRIPFEICA